MTQPADKKSFDPLFFCKWSSLTWAFHLLTLWLALRWILAGWPKVWSFLDNEEGHTGIFLSKLFTDTWLPQFMVVPYTYSIGPIELLLGIMLLLLIKPKLALVFTGLIYISLSFGQMVLGNHDKVLDIGLHLVATCFALALVKHCGFALWPSNASEE